MNSGTTNLDTVSTQVDSLGMIGQTITDSVSAFIHTNSFVIIPIGLIILASIFKYYIGNKYSDTSIVEFFLELPVDLGFLSITLVITYLFVREGDTNFCIALTLISLFIGALSALLRRCALGEFDKEESNVLVIGLIGLPNLLMTFILTLYIINII